MQKLEEKEAKKTDIVPVPVLPQKPVQLMIGIPATAQADIEWARDFGSKFLSRMVPPNSFMVIENRYGIGYSRESIINNFLANPAATHLLFFDTDILPVEMHGVQTLINDTLQDPLNKYIVSGLYYNSLYSGLNCWKNEVALKYQDIKDSPDPVIEVDKVGMGYCIIQKSLFNILNMEPRPLFNYKIMEGNVMESEDFTFLKMLASKYNIRPWVDTRVTAQHIKRVKINIDGGVQF